MSLSAFICAHLWPGFLFGDLAVKKVYGRRQTPRSGHASLCVFRAESTQEIHDEAYRQNQAKPAAADDGAAKVKPAAAEQEKQNN
jgi:hypothetical protein